MKKQSAKNKDEFQKVKDWYVKVDRQLCIGAATCVAIADKTFTLDKDNKAIILKTANKQAKEEILDAAKGCPTAAIIIKDENGKQIYPKK